MSAAGSLLARRGELALHREAAMRLALDALEHGDREGAQGALEMAAYAAILAAGPEEAVVLTPSEAAGLRAVLAERMDAVDGPETPDAGPAVRGWEPTTDAELEDVLGPAWSEMSSAERERYGRAPEAERRAAREQRAAEGSPPPSRLAAYPALDRWRRAVLERAAKAGPLEVAAAWELTALECELHEDRELADRARARAAEVIEGARV